MTFEDWLRRRQGRMLSALAKDTRFGLVLTLAADTEGGVVYERFAVAGDTVERLTEPTKGEGDKP